MLYSSFNWLTNYMEQSRSWEPKRPSTGPAIPRCQWNYYPAHNTNPHFPYPAHNTNPHLPCSYHPATSSISAADQYSPHPYAVPSSSVLLLPFHLHLSLPSGVFRAEFSTKTLYVTLASPIPATFPAQLILLGLVTRMTFGEEYWLKKFVISSYFN